MTQLGWFFQLEKHPKPGTAGQEQQTDCYWFPLELLAMGFRVILRVTDFLAVDREIVKYVHEENERLNQSSSDRQRMKDAELL